MGAREDREGEGAAMSIEATINAAVANPATDHPPREAGVYIILNLVTLRVYVGQSKNIAERWRSHRYHLTRGRHSNARLQADWNLFGSSCFRFHVASLLEPAEALRREREMTIDALRGDCYNLHAAACPGRSVVNGEKLEQRSIRLTAAQWAKIEAHGMAWLRKLIQRAKP